MVRPIDASAHGLDRRRTRGSRMVRRAFPAALAALLAVVGCSFGPEEETTGSKEGDVRPESAAADRIGEAPRAPPEDSLPADSADSTAAQAAKAQNGAGASPPQREVKDGLTPAAEATGQEANQEKQRVAKAAPGEAQWRSGAEGRDAAPVETPGLGEEEMAKLLRAAEAFASKLAQGLHAGDERALDKQLLSDDDLRALLTSGGYDIVASHITPVTRRKLRGLVEILKGKIADHRWKAGRLTRTPTRGIWSKSVPMMTDGAVTFQGQSEPIVLRIEQMLFLESEWKILRVR